MNASEKDSKIKCTLCGAVFEPAENTCGGCVINKNCKLICCPNCGFGFPRESRLAGLIMKLGKKQRSR